MSVHCDKFICYSIDIEDEFFKLDEDSREKWLEDFKGKNTEEFDKINYAPYYGAKSSLRNKVVVLYDGMSGTYCKLIYVIEYEREADEENSDTIVDCINELLIKVEAPNEIKQKLKRVYKAMFGVETEKCVKTEYIVHWN